MIFHVKTSELCIQFSTAQLLYPALVVKWAFQCSTIKSTSIADTAII